MKEGWEIKKLGEVCNLYQPKTISGEMLEEDGKYLVYGANGVIGRYSKYNHEESQVLLTCRGATCGSINISEPYSWINGNAMVVKPIDTNQILQQYLKYYLISVDWSEVITGAAQPQITRQTLSPLHIAFPTYAEQEKIVAELDCLSGIIEKKKQQLKEYDALAQSIFYEMFGDPVENEKGWEMKKMGDISTIGTGATPSRLKEDLYYGGGIPWVKTTEVQNCDITKTEETITKLAIEETNCKLYPSGTLLMAMYGQGKTRGQIAKLKISATTNQACAAIMLNETICNLEYIYELLFINYDNIRTMAQGGNQANLNLKLVSSIPIILPPLSLQQAFATKIEAIEKQKELIKKSIEEVETLFNSRMEYYFN
jgi:type I restriction enzyme S subunit